LKYFTFASLKTKKKLRLWEQKFRSACSGVYKPFGQKKISTNLSN